MSEYQYYEFRAIDRPLTRQQQEELRRLSTRAEITAHSFTNEYSFGDFRGDSEKLMFKYFDAHLYVANWGTHTLMFRLPLRVVDPSAFSSYFASKTNKILMQDDLVVLRFGSNEEGGGEWIEGSGMIDPLLPLREELLAGDLRCLYIAWLSGVTDTFSYAQDEEATREPSVPAGLQTLSAAQKEFAEFMRVDRDLLAAAAERSAEIPDATATAEKDLSAWLAKQPGSRTNSWLIKLLTDEGIGPRLEILREFRRAHSKPVTPAAGKPRSLAELLAQAKVKEEERKAGAATAAAAKKRREAAARARYLDGLAGQEEKLWKQAEEAIETKKTTGYDQAIPLLVDLRDLADRQGKLKEATTRLAALRAKHKSKTAFLRKMRQGKLVD